jgi:hypothetical protein
VGGLLIKYWKNSRTRPRIKSPESLTHSFSLRGIFHFVPGSTILFYALTAHNAEIHHPSTVQCASKPVKRYCWPSFLFTFALLSLQAIRWAARAHTTGHFFFFSPLLNLGPSLSHRLIFILDSPLIVRLAHALALLKGDRAKDRERERERRWITVGAFSFRSTSLNAAAGVFFPPLFAQDGARLLGSSPWDRRRLLLDRIITNI